MKRLFASRSQDPGDPADGPLPIRPYHAEPPGINAYWMFGTVLVVGIYTTERQSTVYRWDNGLDEAPTVIHWNLDGPPHRCGPARRHCPPGSCPGSEGLAGAGRPLPASAGRGHVMIAMSWREFARTLPCHGLGSLFFGPENETGPAKLRREEQAKALCKPCPVRSACLESALRAESQPGQYGGPWGVFGGLGPEQRAVLLAQRPAAAAAPLRLEHCKGAGRHLRTPENTRPNPAGGVRCKDCERERYLTRSKETAA